MKDEYIMTIFEKQQIFNNAYTKVVYELMRISSKTFISVGLQLNATNIYFESNETFSLRGFTFAYFNPIDNSIHVNIEDEFFTCTNTDELHGKLFFILFHEIMHKLLTHSERGKSKKSMLWNIAADYEVHNMYYVFAHVNQYTASDKHCIEKYFNVVDSFLLQEKSKFLFDQKYLENIAEEIYEMIINSKEEECEFMELSLNDMMSDSNSSNNDIDAKVTATKTKYTLPNGQTIETTNIEWPKNVPTQFKKSEEEKEIEKTSDMTNKSLLENTFSEIVKEERERGYDSAACKKFLKKLFHIKIDWEKILRNSLQTILDKADYFAWSKVRTSTFLLSGMPYLPDVIEDNEKYGTLVISRDESGSMSDDDIAKAVQIIIEAKAHYKKIVLIKHDHNITKIESFEDISKDMFNSINTRESCGGTSHKEIFEYLKDYQKEHRDEKISCYIGITDMESDIEKYQTVIPADVPIIYLTPYKIDKSYEKIIGKIIPIE